MNKTYVVICGFADVVAGGPIYYRNKIIYMEAQGWNVVVIPTSGGKKVLIQGMERFLGPYIPFILDMPSEYSKKQRRKLVDIFERFIPQNQDEVVIETGTDYTCYWGEALAERIGAKHIIIFLDEQNERVDEKVIGFYEFKYARREMACITNEVMQHFFKGYMNLQLDECRSLACCCHNSIEDYEHPLIKQIERSEYNIGYIGRLEKPFIPPIIQGFINFAERHSDSAITVVFFGGAFEQKTIDRIKAQFEPLQNVRLIITGYLFPLPLKALKKIDVFVSGAGSSLTAAKAGVRSVMIDMLSYETLGLMLDYEFKEYAKCPLGNTVADYLEWILVKQNAPAPLPQNYENDWLFIEEKFAEHIQFMENSVPTKEYYDMEKLGVSKKRRWKRFFRTLLGLKIYNGLHNAEARFLLWKAGLSHA